MTIGIDLGTTVSCVGTWENGKVEMIAGNAGDRLTPSVVSFVHHPPLVGEAADAMRILYPKQTIFGVKRLIGLQFSDARLTAERARLPYTIVEKDGLPVIKVDYLGSPAYFTPEQISAQILIHLKKMAESYHGQPIDSAVVTLPAHFNEAQRRATRAAAEIAGLPLSRLLTEPTAACLAYGHAKGKEENRVVLVFELGGETFDVSAVRIERGLYSVLAIGGNAHLGGEDFDARVTAHLAEQYRKATGKDPSGNRKAMEKLRRAASKAKIELSQRLEVAITIEALHDGDDFETSITRSKFEDLCADLFERTISPLAGVLRDARLRKDQIDEVVLIGGSTRIPKIQALVKDFFDGKEPTKNINPDEAVAYGAAVCAATIAGDEELEAILLTDVNPLSLGTDRVDGRMSVLIPRNAPIPATVTKVYTTSEDDQPDLHVGVYEGGEEACAENHLVGEFVLQGIERGAAGTPLIKVTFSLDANRILEVSAVDARSGAKEGIRINSSTARLSGEELEAAKRRAEEIERRQEKQRRAREARAGLKKFLRNWKARFASRKENWPPQTKEAGLAILAKGLAWVGEHGSEEAEMYRAKEEQIREKLRRIVGDKEL